MSFFSRAAAPEPAPPDEAPAIESLIALRNLEK